MLTLSGRNEAGGSARIAPGPGLMTGVRLQRVMAQLDAMPASRREAFLMHRVEDMTYLQIARRMHTSIRSVETHVMLAMRQLAADVG